MTVPLHRGTAVEMTRKDSEKEAERPHYYSQFWLDVAAGRKIIGASRPGEEEAAEPEPQEVAPRRSARSASATVEHEEPAYSEVAAPTAEEVDDTEAYTEPEPEEDFLAGEEELDHDQELPNILVDEEPEVPDVDLLDEDENEDEDFYEEEEEEEEEDEDLDWGRGRKKPKPGRQAKQPPKRTRRDRDRRY